MPWSEHDPFLRREVENGIFTSPRGLAQARSDLSALILANPFGCLETNRLAELATEKGIFGSDELDALRELQTPLPAPWLPGNKTDKYIPSNYQLCRLIRNLVESDQRVGVYFMVADMINAGHLSALAQAKASGECDFLLLMLTTDLLTAAMKSRPEDIRPKLSFAQRIYMASQIGAVDAIYAVPVVASQEHCIFEMAALARAQAKLQTKFNNCGDERILPLDPERIRDLSRECEKEWDFYLQAWLGISPWRLTFDPQRSFYQSDFPAELQIPYKYLWGELEDLVPDRLTLFVSKYDQQMAKFHTSQAAETYFHPEELKVVVIDPRCPKSSSTVLFGHHPLRSEALREDFAVLDMLQDWEAEWEELHGDESQFFGKLPFKDLWKNPLLPPLPKLKPRFS